MAARVLREYWHVVALVGLFAALVVLRPVMHEQQARLFEGEKPRPEPLTPLSPETAARLKDVNELKERLKKYDPVEAIERRSEQAARDARKLEEGLPRCPVRFRLAALITHPSGHITVAGWVASPEARRKFTEFVAGLGLSTPVSYDLIYGDPDG
jgi:hypothetical protein